MEIPPKILIIICLLLVIQKAFSQNRTSFCKAVDHKNFNKIERIIRHEVRKNKKGQVYFNGEGSGNQINLSSSIDSITESLKTQKCIEDAYWDKCQEKLMLYPGYAVIGVRFKSDQSIIEKCFHIQLGKTGRINLFGWKFKIAKSKQQLVYKKMFDCQDFIQIQRENCKE